MITVGTTPPDARRAAVLTHRFDGVYATVGLHPGYSAEYTDKALVQATLRELAAMDKVVALGEMGFDRHYPEPSIETQRPALDWQLEVAAEIDLPIIIHNREATDDTLPVLRASGIDPARFVFHCFTGSDAELDAILAFGACVSFTGIATFSSASYLAAASARVPIERLMIETDSPYLTPAPHRKVRINEPQYVRFVAACLAERRGMEVGAFVSRMDANAERFFRLASKSRSGGAQA
jgi:TatD DNase family protein